MARGKIASLFIGLGANTAELDKGLGRSKKKLKSFSKNVTAIGKAAAKSFGVIGVSATAALTVIYKQSSTSIDRMAKLSDQIGVTVGGLQSMRFAAELNGVAQGALDKSLEKFVKTLGEANQGIGTGKEVLDQLGLSADTLINLGTDEAIKVIADEIGNLTTAADKAAASTALFGRSGGGMVNVFKDGRSAIVAASKELKSYGLLLSRAGAAKIEAANDAWTRVGAVIKNLGYRFSTELAPYVEEVANWFLTAVKNSGDFGAALRTALKSGVEMLGGFIDKLNEYRLAWARWTVDSKKDAMESAQARAKEITDLENLDKGISAYIDRKKAFYAQEKNGKKIIEDAVKATEDWFKAVQLIDELSKEKPSEALSDWFKEIETNANNSAAAIKNQSNEALKAASINDFSAKLDQDIENHNATEEEMIRHVARMAEINDPGDEEDIENYSNRLEMERNFQAELNDIVASGNHSRNEFDNASFKSQFQSVAGNLAASTAQAAKHDKTMFKINKAANIANAIMSAYTGASKSLQMYPMPLAGVMAAVHLAAGFANVKAIKSQTFGSQSMSSPSIGGSAPVNIPTPNLETSVTEESQAQQGITIIVNGHILDKTGLEDLVQEATQGITSRDGLLFDQDTAQAQLVAA